MRGNGQQVGNKPETASTSQRNIHFLGGVVIPGAFQQNVNPSRAGTGELHTDWSGTQYRAMGFCLAITRTSCQRWEQFFETQVMEVSETPSLKNLASGCFKGCCLAVVSYLFEIPRTVTHQAPLCMFGQEYWSGLPFPSPGDLLRSRIERAFPALVGRYFTTEPPGKTCSKGTALFLFTLFP